MRPVVPSLRVTKTRIVVVWLLRLAASIGSVLASTAGAKVLVRGSKSDRRYVVQSHQATVRLLKNKMKDIHGRK